MYKKIIAKYESVCYHCRSTVYVGDAVGWMPRCAGVVCKACLNAGKRVLLKPKQRQWSFYSKNSDKVCGFCFRVPHDNKWWRRKTPEGMNTWICDSCYDVLLKRLGSVKALDDVSESELLRHRQELHYDGPVKMSKHMDKTVGDFSRHSSNGKVANEVDTTQLPH